MVRTATKARKVTTILSRPSIEKMVVTPEMAADWLEHNTHNRVLSEARVKEYEGILARKEWRLNNDAITFDTKGVLQNGQHRLWAILNSGIPAELFVARGLETAAQHTMDTGRKRNLADTLRLEGEANASLLAAAIVIQWRLENNLIRTARKPTVAQALEVLKQNPGLRDGMPWARKILNRFYGPTATFATAWYTFHQIDPDAANEFFEKLVSGVGLQEGSPILALRRWMERQQSAGAQTKAGSIMTHALFIKAWNALREGRHIETLVWRTAGTYAEPFPTPK